jgi:phthiocerol/phenolphthiocerol synthesis type-I polyketide synthase E
MLAVRLEGKIVEPMLSAGASIAAFNSSKFCTVSGPTEVLKSFQQELEAKKIASRFLPTSHAFHSAMMEPMLPEFTEIARQTPWQAPKLPWISTCTGTWIKSKDIADPSYWSRQLRHAVRFADALEHVIGDPSKILLEVGPGQTLAQLARQHPAKSKNITICSTLASNAAGGEQAAMITALGQLWIDGVKPDWDGFYANEKRRRVPLPTYPFERKRYWVEPAKSHSIARSEQAVVLNPKSGDADDAIGSPELLEKVIREQISLMTQQLEMLETGETNRSTK